MEVDFWRDDPPTHGACWVCGDETEWILADVGYQHPDCDRYPSPDGDVWIVRGRRVD